MKPKVYIEGIADKKNNVFRAKCPFHEEKTPSFFMYKDKGIYRCFSCDATGNIEDLDVQVGMVFA